MSDLSVPLKELNDWLAAKGTNIELFVIGAFALHLHGVSQRYTLDVDTISSLDSEVRGKVEEIGEKYGLPSWLNDQANTVVLPAGIEQRALEYNEFSHIKIKYAAREDLIKLKVAAYYYRKQDDPKDLDDIISLSPKEEEIQEGISFLLSSHLPEVEAFHAEFKREVGELEKELENVLEL